MFKYKDYLTKLDCSCPDTAKLKNINAKVFRLVHEDISHENNFIPPLIISPSRIGDFDECDVRCSAYALSFYTDFNKVEARLKKLVERKAQALKVLGNCIAEGDIVETDGLADTPKKGHFNFYEFDGVNLQTRFRVIKKIA